MNFAQNKQLRSQMTDANRDREELDERLAQLTNEIGELHDRIRQMNIQSTDIQQELRGQLEVGRLFVEQCLICAFGVIRSFHKRM